MLDSDTNRVPNTERWHLKSIQTQTPNPKLSPLDLQKLCETYLVRMVPTLSLANGIPLSLSQLDIFRI